MKNIFVFIFLAVWSSTGFCQYQNSRDNERKNAIKFLPLTLSTNSVSFQYERMIDTKNSLSLQVGLPNQKSIIGKYGIGGTTDLKTAEFGTTTLRTAFRHYTGKQKSLKGFYIEPYLKYQHLKGVATLDGMNDLDIPYAGVSDIKLNSFNLGCQLGIQFLIAKRVSLDFYFLGLEGGFLSGNMITTPTPSNQYDNTIVLTVLKDVIDQKITDLPSFIRKKLTSVQTDTQVIVKGRSIPYPLYRGGVSIGFTF